jgi:hypothetical protein
VALNESGDKLYFCIYRKQLFVCFPPNISLTISRNVFAFFCTPSNENAVFVNLVCKSRGDHALRCTRRRNALFFSSLRFDRCQIAVSQTAPQRSQTMRPRVTT